jgi:hypothetical protein
MDVSVLPGNHHSLNEYRKASLSARQMDSRKPVNSLKQQIQGQNEWLLLTFYCLISCYFFSSNSDYTNSLIVYANFANEQLPTAVKLPT